MQHNSFDKDPVKVKRFRQIFIISCLFLVLVIFTIVRFIEELPKTSILHILVSPTDTSITIDDKKYSSGDIKIKPGTYRFKAEKAGFQTEETEFTVKKGDKKYLYYCLKPDEKHQNWYKEHKKDLDVCNEIDQFLDSIYKLENMTDPIFNVTPFHSEEKRFYIDSKKNEDNSITVTIRPLSCKEAWKKILKENALDHLRKQGINLDNYKIEYHEDC